MGTKSGKDKVISMSDPAWLVFARFPKQWESIRKLRAQRPEFRALCSEYAEAVEALRSWGVSDAPVEWARVKEYQSVVARLDAEIERFLQNQQEENKGG